MICGHEVDFLIGNTVIEIDGHKQNTAKNKTFLEAGYSVVHFNNTDIDTLTTDKLKIYGRNKYSRPSN